MPYPFAHPAAVLPLVPLLGRAAVPSALAIGAMIPDAWYFVPGLARADSHGAAGLLWFCLPVGLAAYFLFHSLAKAPLIALMPRSLACRLARYAGPPRAPWPAVAVSLLAGALTHVAWDSVAHGYAVAGTHPLQHLSTLLGTMVVLGWSTRQLRRLPPQPLPPRLELPETLRACLLAILLVVLAAGAWFSAEAPGLRQALREAWIGGTSALGAALLALGVAWKLRR